MRHPPKESKPAVPYVQLLAYVADLELEVDRLCRQGQFLQDKVGQTLKRVRLLCAAAPQAGDAPSRLSEAGQAAAHLAADSGVGQGTTFVALLPRYDLEDYLT